jgi:hypothetical protein
MKLMRSLPHVKKHSTRTLLSLAVGIISCTYIGYITWTAWELRGKPNFHPTRDLNWKMISGGDLKQTQIRVEGTAFWLPAKNQILSSSAHIFTEQASTTLRNIQTESSIAISASAVAHLAITDQTTFTLLSGVARIRGPLNVMLTAGQRQIVAGQTQTVAVVTTAATIETAFVDTLYPAVGTNIELIKTPVIEFAWTVAGSENSALEFAREPSFQSVLFTQAVGSRTSTKYDFGDRGHGAWFARIRDRDRTLAATSFHTFDKLTPDRLRRLGRRWLTWEDRGPSSFYRVEISSTANFSKISQSIFTRTKFFDLSLAHEPGLKYLRIVGIDQNETEYAGETLPIDIPKAEQLLQARTEFGDPSLALFARGWRIQLNESEAKRIREGYVILRESELRGIKVSSELDEKIKSHPGKYLFEVAKDVGFTNPERVRPTSRGELLPPALPLGTIFTRIREIEDDGITLGAYGPPSKISTLLPAPGNVIARFSETAVVLNWTFPFEAAGFEVEIRTSGLDTPTTYRTQSRTKEIPLSGNESFEWMVTAIDDAGRPVSVSSISTRAAKPTTLLKAIARDTTAQDQEKERVAVVRELASINPSLLALEAPLDDAIVVGGATATKYGRLQWKDLDPANNTKTDSFVVEIATDGDFVNVIERASTSRLHYTLQGDLPEGSLFWRVKKRKLNSWSASRKFEIVYE